MMLPEEAMNNITALAYTGIRIHQAITPVQENVLRIVKLLLSVPLSIRFLNNWNDFESKLLRTFPNQTDSFYRFDLRKIRNLLILVYVILPYALIFVAMHTVGYIKTEYWILNLLLEVIFSFFVIAVECVYDVQFFLSLITLRMGFTKVKRCIQNSMCEEY